MPVKPIPEGYHAVTPYLIVSGAAEAIEFYKRAFDAQDLARMDMPGGKIGHAEIRVGDSVIMLADEFPDMGARSPKSLGGTAVYLYLYVTDSDAVIAQAVAAGAKITRPIEDKFYGDRAGTITDPFGHVWNVSTHKEDLSLEEIKRRATELFGA